MSAFTIFFPVVWLRDLLSLRAKRTWRGWASLFFALLPLALLGLNYAFFP